MAQIRQGMEVIDASGKVIGKVAYVRTGAQHLTDTSELQPEILGRGESSAAAGLVGRLLQGGYIKIDEVRQSSRWVHHYYATEEEIVSVEGGKVRLSRVSHELMKSLD